MIFFVVFSFITLFLYSVIILNYVFLWHKRKSYDINLTDELPVTVIVIARNEEKNIGNFILSVFNQDYVRSQIQLIVVDDNSSDNTSFVISNFMHSHPDFDIEQIRLDKSKGEFSKKTGISKAILSAKNEFIVCSDADCIHSKKWLGAMVSALNNAGAKYVTGPVIYRGAFSFMEDLLNIELSSLIGITAGAIYRNTPIMSNGANMAFCKSAFLEVDGYKGNEHILSGDDLFLLLKMNQAFPNAIDFVKSNEALVFTQMPKTIMEFIHQRVRWASKTKRVRNKFILWNGFLILATNMVFLISLILYATHQLNGLFALIIIFPKLIIDIALSSSVLAFFKMRNKIILIPILALIYPVYLLVIGMLSIRGKFLWKERIG